MTTHKMGKKILSLFIAILMLTSCLQDHDELYVFRCDDAHFTFSILEKKDASVLILENSDSIIYTPAMHGNYAGIAFYLLDSVNTIYIPRGLDFFQADSDSIQGYIKTRPSAVSYKIKSNKYEIKDLQQSPETLEYDYSILGSNYWFFEGNIDERGGGYTFHYSRSNSNQIYPTLEAISQNSIEK